MNNFKQLLAKYSIKKKEDKKNKAHYHTNCRRIISMAVNVTKRDEEYPNFINHYTDVIYKWNI
jgi:hypothetical protein